MEKKWTGIVVPDLIIYKTLNSIVKLIRNDFNKWLDLDEKTIIWKLLGKDWNNEDMVMNNYNYFKQVRKMFTDPKNMNVYFGYNHEVAKIISMHIIIPSENAGTPAIGQDEGYNDDAAGENEKYFTQSFDSNYQIMISSDNQNEVMMTYTVMKAVLLMLVPYFALNGLLNMKISGNDVIMRDDNFPINIYHKVINLSFTYELIVPQLLRSEIVRGIMIGDDFKYTGDGWISNDENKDGVVDENNLLHSQIEPGAYSLK